VGHIRLPFLAIAIGHAAVAVDVNTLAMGIPQLGIPQLGWPLDRGDVT
jgi:hypothetical protein